MGVLQTCKREYYAFFADSEEKYKFHMGVLQTCKKEYYVFFLLSVVNCGFRGEIQIPHGSSSNM